MDLQNKLDELLQEREQLQDTLSSISDAIWNRASTIKQTRVSVELGDVSRKELTDLEDQQEADVLARQEAEQRLDTVIEAIKQAKTRINQHHADERRQNKLKLTNAVNSQRTIENFKKAALDLCLVIEAKHGSFPMDLGKALENVCYNSGLLRLPGNSGSKDAFVAEYQSLKRKVINGEVV